MTQYKVWFDVPSRVHFPLVLVIRLNIGTNDAEVGRERNHTKYKPTTSEETYLIICIPQPHKRTAQRSTRYERIYAFAIIPEALEYPYILNKITPFDGDYNIHKAKLIRSRDGVIKIAKCPQITHTCHKK